MLPMVVSLKVPQGKQDELQMIYDTYTRCFIPSQDLYKHVDITTYQHVFEDYPEFYYLHLSKKYDHFIVRRLEP